MQDNLTNPSSAWREQLRDSPAEIADVLKRVTRVAVIGIKPESVGGPAFYVPQRMQQSGYEIIPVPVYYPEIQEILGAPVHRSLATISPPVDMVLLFRRPEDVPRHLDEILAHRPAVVWMQLGIQHAEVAEQLARQGIDVVQNHCTKIELDRIGR